VIHSFLGVSIIEARTSFFNRFTGIILLSKKARISSLFFLGRRKEIILALPLLYSKNSLKVRKDKGRREERALFVVRW
jgi:hypothetical protein